MNFRVTVSEQAPVAQRISRFRVLLLARLEVSKLVGCAAVAIINCTRSSTDRVGACGALDDSSILSGCTLEDGQDGNALVSKTNSRKG